MARKKREPTLQELTETVLKLGLEHLLQTDPSQWEMYHWQAVNNAFKTGKGVGQSTTINLDLKGSTNEDLWTELNKEIGSQSKLVN